MKSTENIQDYPSAHHETQTFIENGQQISPTVFSCPDCDERFGFSRAVFGPHATADQLKAIAANPDYGPDCGLYRYCESLPRAQPKDPVYSIFTPAPGYERFSDEVPTPAGAVMRFEKATTRPADGKGPSGVNCPTHSQIVELEATDTDKESVELLRAWRDWKDRRAPKPEPVSQFSFAGKSNVLLEKPIVFETPIAAVFKCRQCNTKLFAIIF